MTTDKNESRLERLQKSGLTIEQLQDIVGGQSRPDFIERARASGLSMSELKDIMHKSSDSNTGHGSIGTSVTGIGGMNPAGGVSPQ